MTTREPEWDAQEVGYLLASRAIQLEPKNSVGIPLTDAMDPANQFAWEQAKLPTMDWALKAHDDARDAYYKANEKASRNGHMWRPPTLKKSAS